MSALRFTLSVDDGHPSDLKLAELLDRHELQATFYVPMANCEGPPVMSASQLRMLATRFEIGSHTAEHRFLTHLSRTAAWRQIRDGKAALEDALGRRVSGFCYPGGRYRREHVSLVRAAGFSYARSTQNLRTDAGQQALEMPTTVQFYPHGRRVLLRNFLSQRHWQARHAALLAALPEQDWQGRLYALFSHACRQGSVFHLWLHTADVDTLRLWPALDAFLACIGRRLPRAQCVSNGDLYRSAHASPPHPAPDRLPAGTDTDAQTWPQASFVRPFATRDAVPFNGGCGESSDAPDWPESRGPDNSRSPFHTIRK